MNSKEEEFDMLSDNSASEDESCSDDDSESDDDDSDEEVADNNDAGRKTGRLHSSDDDPERECCPVCLNKFIGQDLGSPESCEHTFCYECILEWSKNINTCPIDRTQFKYIYLRAVPQGNVLRKVPVTVLPKAPEETLPESITLCEVCRRGDREDRLLLCDSCDLAYHCECLDPPLFHIPIEEWFCPPCSGILQNGAVAGPSHYNRTRRIIPRTRASEAVRSRVQNLRTRGSSNPRSTSGQRKSTTTKSPKKRRRRYYGKTYKKVVSLARTKKDMLSGQKSKTGARGSTIVLTYRRKRRRRARRKVSKRSRASTRVLPIPSAKQRIAKQLGIAKPLQGSTVPSIVKPSGRSRAISRIDKTPSCSLFGNKHQLMDFSENFNEDLKNVPSTSTSVSARRTSSESICPPSSINILDSIIAGQKILHTKSDHIVIKTDGSLVLKGEKSSSSKVPVSKNVAEGSSRTPMSIALAKEGVKHLTSSNNSNSSRKKYDKDSQRKFIAEKRLAKFSPEKTDSEQPISQSISRKSSIGTKPQAKIGGDKIRYAVNQKKYSTNLSTKQQQNDTISNASISRNNNCKSVDQIQSNFSSDLAEELFSDSRAFQLRNVKKETSGRIRKLENCSEKTSSKEVDNCSNSVSRFQSSSTNLGKGKVHIKREILSDDETKSDALTNDTESIKIKKEVLSDEETNIDCWILNDDNSGHKSDSFILSTIKKEPMELNVCNGEGCSGTSKNNTNSVSNVVAQSSCINKCKNNEPMIKIKEEIPSDSEDYSQSLVANRDTQDLLSCSKSPLHKKDSLDFHREEKIKKLGKEENKNTHVNRNLSIDVLPCTQAAVLSAITDFNVDLPCTQAVPSPAVTDSEDDEVPCTQAALSPAVTDSEDDEVPCTQAVPSPALTDSEDEEVPCTQVALSPATTDSEDDDIPSAQAAPSPAVTDSEDDDISCTQAVISTVISEGNLPCTQTITSENSDPEDDIPCTQAVASPINSDSEDDMPCTQIATSVLITNSEDDATQDALSVNVDSENNIPCTQVAATFAVVSSKNDIPATQMMSDTQVATIPVASNFVDDLPCTQAASLSRNNNYQEDGLPCTQAASPINNDNFQNNDLPCTQAAFSSSVNKRRISSCISSDASICKSSNINTKETSVGYNSHLLTQTNDLSKVQNKDNVRTTAILATTQLSNIPKNTKKPFETKNVDSSLDQTTAQTSKESNLPSITSAIDVSKNGITFSDTQASANEDLPATQISDPILKESSNTSSNLNNNHHDDKEKNLNLETILSNIKQLVSSLSANNHDISDHVSLQGDNVDGLSSDTQNDDISNKSNISNELVDSKHPTESLQDASSVSSDSKKESSENLQSSNDSENEDLSSEKLKEILEKSSKITPSKKVGVHKHLPQVIAAVPAKQQIKIKPSNKKTFSFEEVAKLEAPKQNPNIFPNKVSGNTFSDSVTGLDDSLPQTQRVNYETIENTNNESKKILKKDNKKLFSHSGGKSLSEKLHLKTVGLSSNTLNVSLETNIEDLPATQVTSLVKENVNESFPRQKISIETLRNNSADKIKELLSCNSKNKSKSVKFNSLNTLSSQVIESKLSDNTDDILPATQIQALNHKVISSKERKGAKDVINLSDNLEDNKALILNKKWKKETSSINSPMSRELLSAKSGIHKKSMLDFDDLPPTQVCNYSLPIHGKVFETCDVTSEKSPKKIQNSLSENNILHKTNNCSSDFLKKKSSAQNNLNLQESHSEAYEDHVKVSKRQLGCQNFAKERVETTNNSKNLAKKLKKESDEGSNKQISCLDLKQTIKKEKTESSESKTAEDKVMFEKTNNVEIKQEKMDFEFLKPNLLIFDMNKSASATSKNIKIKSEIPCDDSLPATQAVNIDQKEEDSLPATQAVSFHPTEVDSHIGTSFNRIEGSTAASCILLASSKIKSEVIDDTDDDITIIECVEASDAKKKDEIVISIDDDDESEDTVPHSDAKEEALASKIEKCVVKSVVSKCQAVTKTSVNMQKGENNNSKIHSSSKENKQRCHSDSVKLKHDKNNSKQVIEKTDKNKILELSENDIKKKKKHKEDTSKSESKSSKNDQKNAKKHKDPLLDKKEKKFDKRSKEDTSKSESKSSKSDQENAKKCKDPLLDKKEKKYHSDSRKLESSKEKCTESSKKHRDSSEEKKKEKVSLNSKCIKRDSKEIYSKELSCGKNKDNLDSKEIHSKELSPGKNKDNLDSKCIKSDLKSYHAKDLCFEKQTEKANLESRLKKSESKQTHAKDFATEKGKEKLNLASKCLKRDSKEIDSVDFSTKKRKETISDNSKDSKRLKRDAKQNNYKDSSNEKSKEKKSVKGSQSNSVTVDVKNVSKAINHDISKPMLFEEHSKDLNNDSRCSSEKENSKVSYSDKHSKKEICITLKPINNKRSHDIIEENNKIKKIKYNHSVDSESCSSDDVYCLKSDLFTGTNSNSGINSGFDLVSDEMSTPCSDTGLENVNVLNRKSSKESSNSLPKTDFRKISFKEDLKEEIENEVKLVLKPFFSTGLITKDDYKDIMRRAVPKIFKNCHNCINPEKIRKLVLSYVSLISKS